MRAAWSGSSARRVVLSGLRVIWQSSNSARTVVPAWPVKAISYVRDRTWIVTFGELVVSAARVPAHWAGVITI